MPWFEPNPSEAQLGFWKDRPFGFVRRVPLWPRPNSGRIDCRFRVKDTTPDLIPLASRYGVYFSKALEDYDPNDTDWSSLGAFDFVTRGDNHIGVLTDENVNGISLDIDIKHFESLPQLGDPGIEFKTDFLHAVHGDFASFQEYAAPPIGNNWQYDMDTDLFGFTGAKYTTGGAPVWPELLLPRIFAVSECYRFEFLPVGFASFNGSDAYIKLDNLMNVPFFPFKISCEVKLNQTANHWPVLGRDGQGGFCGMRDDNIVFGSFEIDTSWTPETDEWLLWEFDFEWPDLLKYNLRIGGTLVWTSVQVRQNFQMDTIGVYKHGVSGTLWADMDMRNLKILQGTPSSPTTKLDMPLLENALDIGPEGNHGTTFNMALPSV